MPPVWAGARDIRSGASGSEEGEMRAHAMVVLSAAMLVGCATSSDSGFFFTSWVGHPPATSQEEADGRTCYDKGEWVKR